MKVLIVSLPRTGSTNLLLSLGRLLNLKTYSEPFEKKYVGEDYKFNQPHIIKTMINDLKVNPLDFDKVIILARKDLKAQLESFTFALKNDKWHENYKVNDIEIVKEYYYNFNAMRLNIEKLSKEINIPITWYEDLYSGNKNLVLDTIKLWNLRLEYKYLKEFIDPIKKYRKTGTLV